MRNSQTAFQAGLGEGLGVGKKLGAWNRGRVVHASPAQAWWITLTSWSVQDDLQEAGRAQAGRVAEQRGAGVQAELAGDRSGTNAQAAWTCPQQYRCGPMPASHRATSSAFFIRLGCSSEA